MASKAFHGCRYTHRFTAEDEGPRKLQPLAIERSHANCGSKSYQNQNVNTRPPLLMAHVPPPPSRWLFPFSHLSASSLSLLISRASLPPFWAPVTSFKAQWKTKGGVRGDGEHCHMTRIFYIYYHYPICWVSHVQDLSSPTVTVRELERDDQRPPLRIKCKPRAFFVAAW